MPSLVLIRAVARPPLNGNFTVENLYLVIQTLGQIASPRALRRYFRLEGLSVRPFAKEFCANLTWEGTRVGQKSAASA